MLKIFGPKATRRDDEEKKEESEGSGGRRRSPGEIRLQTELSELDLPANTQIDFPDPNNIMHFNITLDVDDR